MGSAIVSLLVFLWALGAASSTWLLWIGAVLLLLAMSAEPVVWMIYGRLASVSTLERMRTIGLSEKMIGVLTYNWGGTMRPQACTAHTAHCQHSTHSSLPPLRGIPCALCVAYLYQRVVQITARCPLRRLSLCRACIRTIGMRGVSTRPGAPQRSPRPLFRPSRLQAARCWCVALLIR